MLAEGVGIIGWLLVIYCMIFGVIDVFLRYGLNAASLWIGPTIQAAMVLLACASGAYALNHGSFVKLDLFYANFPPRVKAACDIATSVFTFLFLGVLIWKGISAAQLSWMLNQTTPTAVPIPIYPIKMVIPVAGVIVLLVVLKNLMKDVGVLFRWR